METKATTPYHFTQGGTGVTNFSDEDLDVYEAAISIYGDPTIIIGEPMICANGKIYHNYALHHLEPIRDLSDFWDVFDQIEEVKKLCTF